MGKLRGLLDSANETIGGLLGDFPEGFNRSAVAGFPGWTGDIAYMGDMVRRYASGRPQIAAQDFPGTTDYFAAQSGYPIPQTLSGQLGAMLGGFVSPSPGDVAKLGMLGGKILGGLGPALAAIPFWHGSPHKYDVADLSKIDTGEGTHNYVMFDEKGIKLLERNGEPINPPGPLDAFVERRAGKAKPYKQSTGAQ